MNSNLRVDNKAIAAMRSELEKARVKSSMSVRELVEQMHEALIAARAQGKTLDQMHEDISRHGVHINQATFRKYASELLHGGEKPRRNQKVSLDNLAPVTEAQQGDAGRSSLRSMRSMAAKPM